MLGNTLTATYKSNYPKVVVNKVTGLPEIDPVTGQTKVRDIFVYRITGSPEDLKAYTDSVGNKGQSIADAKASKYVTLPSALNARLTNLVAAQTTESAGDIDEQ